MGRDSPSVNTAATATAADGVQATAIGIADGLQPQNSTWLKESADLWLGPLITLQALGSGRGCTAAAAAAAAAATAAETGSSSSSSKIEHLMAEKLVIRLQIALDSKSCPFIYNMIRLAVSHLGAYILGASTLSLCISNADTHIPDMYCIKHHLLPTFCPSRSCTWVPSCSCA